MSKIFKSIFNSFHELVNDVDESFDNHVDIVFNNFLIKESMILWYYCKGYLNLLTHNILLNGDSNKLFRIALIRKLSFFNVLNKFCSFLCYDSDSWTFDFLSIENTIKSIVEDTSPNQKADLFFINKLRSLYLAF